MAAPADGASSTRRDGCARLGTALEARLHRRGVGNLVAETSSSSSSADAATSPLSHLVAGSIAGGLSRTAVAPLETVRVRLMTGAATTTGGSSPSILAMLADISRREGVRALWKGNAAVVARFAPTKGLDFFTFNLYKRALSAVDVGPVRAGDENGGDHRGGHSPSRPSRVGGVSAQRALAGGLAGATSTALLFPLDNIATRLATSAATGAAMVNGVKVVGALGLLRAAGAVVRTEGVRGLYRGFGPAVLGIVPEAAITYGAYDALKEWAGGRGAEGGAGECGVLEATACGIVAALAGTAATFPASVVSRRMIAGTVPGLLGTPLGTPLGTASSGGTVGGRRARASMGLFRAMRAVAEAEGVSGLYRGLGTASVRLVPMAIVSFASYEWVRRTIDAADARRTKRVGIEVDVA